MEPVGLIEGRLAGFADVGADIQNNNVYKGADVGADIQDNNAYIGADIGADVGADRGRLRCAAHQYNLWPSSRALIGGAEYSLQSQLS